MKLSPHLVDLVQDALLKSFWKKKALKTFLKRPQVSEAFLAQLSNEETKREWLDHLFGKLEPSERGQALIQQMARTLSEQTAFPDLANWEDSAEKIRAAESAVVALKTYLDQKDVQQSSERDMANRRESAEETRKKTMRSISDRAALSDRLNLLGSSLGTQQGGYDFQVWFYDLMDYYEVDNRRPYTSSGRQIDGSITIDGTTYLVELKFTANQSAATDIDSLFKKVSDKSDNTMGLLISMSGFSSVALQEASSSKSPLLLFDHSHLYMILTGVISFPDAVRRVRRHSSQEGQAFLPVADFGG